MSSSDSEPECKSPKCKPQPASPKNATSKDKSFVFDPVALDKKFPDPSKMGDYKVFFGKFKGKLFKELLEDPSYCDYILNLKDIKTNNMYLLAKYLKHKHVKPVEKSSKAKKSKKV